MAHYALLDENNVVTSVVTANSDDLEHSLSAKHNCTVKRTSYNTKGNEHRLEETPFRGNYAGIGYTYDETNDVFVEPKPVKEGWTFTLNTTTWLWEGTEDE